MTPTSRERGREKKGDSFFSSLEGLSSSITGKKERGKEALNNPYHEKEKKQGKRHHRILFLMDSG